MSHAGHPSPAAVPRRRMLRLFGIDPRALAALRIGIAFLVLADLFQRSLDFSTFYASQGLLPFRVALNHVTPLHALSGAYVYQAALFFVAALVASMLLVGFHTRLCTVASWLMLVSLDTQNAIVGCFGDEILRLVTFWCVFLPLGRVWSVDARRNGGRHRHRHASSELREREPVLSFGSAGLLLQVAFIYFFAGLLKTGPDWWENGLAVPIALSMDWLVTPFGAFLASEIDLGLLKSLSFLVVGFEIAGPVLLFSPFATGRIRIVLVAFASCFQLALGLSFFLALMPWIVGVAMVPFLPPSFWDRFERLSPRFRVQPAPAPTPAPESAFVPSLVRGVPGYPRWAAEGVALLCLLWVTAYNIVGLRSEWTFPAPLRSAGQWVRIDQKWAMFSPESPRGDGWYVIVGELQNGSHVNLWWTGPQLSWEKPESISSFHPSSGWSAYEMRLTEPLFDQPEFAHFRRRYAEWHCSRWNSTHSGEETLVQLDVVFIDETTQADLSPPTPTRRSLQFLRCSEGDYEGMGPKGMRKT